MSLHVLISKKGTRVVTASNLFTALELPATQYGRLVRKWIRDLYELDGVLRRPIHGQDFAQRKAAHPAGDYYLSLPLALQIVLRSCSKRKLKYAQQLQKLCRSSKAATKLDAATAFSITALARTLSFTSCQIACERHHLALYRNRNKGSAANWWAYRAQLLGYSFEALHKQAMQRGVAISRKSARNLLLAFNEDELVRTAAVDLFMALGYEAIQALRQAKWVYAAFKAGGFSVCDDRKGVNIFTSSIPRSWMEEIYTLEVGTLLQPWVPQTHEVQPPATPQAMRVSA